MLFFDTEDKQHNKHGGADLRPRRKIYGIFQQRDYRSSDPRGAGLGIWGAINLLEGYGNDNPGANAHVS